MKSTTKGPKKWPKWPKSAKNDPPFGVPRPGPGRPGRGTPAWPGRGRPGPPKMASGGPKRWPKSGIWAFLLYSVTLVGRKSRFLVILGRPGPAPACPAGVPRPGRAGAGVPRPGRAGVPQNGQNRQKTPKNTFFPEMAGLLVQGSFLPRIYAGLTRFSEAHVRSSAILFWCF